MSKQEANIYEIAKEAGVSIATVSRVMNNSASVSEKSTQRVMDAVKKLNYVPNSMARSLSTCVSTTIGVVVPDINNPFFSKILQGITHVADEHGFQVILFDTDESAERELRVLHSLREHRLRGLLVAPVSEKNHETRKQLQSFAALGVPVVLLDREIDSSYFDRVVTQDEDGVCAAIRAFLDTGHKRVAIITGPLDSRPGRERLKGYERAFRESSLPLNTQYIREGDFRMERAYEECMALLSMPEPPTAIFASNNMTTYGCLKAFSQMGLQAGRDISLIGFDDIDALNWLNYNISVVSRDVREMGERAMRLLLKRFEQEASEGLRDCLPTELILRGSEQYHRVF